MRDNILYIFAAIQKSLKLCLVFLRVVTTRPTYIRKKVTLLKMKTTKKVGLLLLIMESIFNVSNTCINELVEELHFLTASASGPVIKEIILSTLRKHGYTFEDSVISELVKDLCQLSPVCAAL